MVIHIAAFEPRIIAGSPVEVVERKGIGHPDTICDALAEELSLALCRLYVEHCGQVLHHNVDKVLLRGGASRPAFGGGEVTRSAELYLAGRATLTHGDLKVPLEELAHDVCNRWIRKHLLWFDPERHLNVRCLVGGGSTELVELFGRGAQRAVALANDTSCGVGYAPLSTLERIVLAVENRLNGASLKAIEPAVGEDIKVMAVRTGARIDLTIACAVVDKAVANLDEYLNVKAQVAALARQVAEEISDVEVAEVLVNAADDPAAGSLYLTVTGISAEAGDDGQAGRGNRANGLITPGRPMTMESVAGKNPLSHVGKLYNIAAGEIAKIIVETLPDVAHAECMLVSAIGKPIDEPQCVSLRVSTVAGRPVVDLAPQIEQITHDYLANIGNMWARLITRDFRLY